MTRCSPRAPKPKESEVDDGSSPDTVRHIDFSTKVEPVVYTPTKREFHCRKKLDDFKRTRR